MKQFFKFMFASIAGMIVMGLVILFIFIGIIGSFVTTDDNPKVEDNSVLHLTLSDPMPDRTNENPFHNINFSNFEPDFSLGLDKFLTTIKAAKTDEKIKGIYLDISSIPVGMANLEEVRAALLDFKTSGKWIISYSEIYTQKAYYVASVADEVYLNPAGIMELRGLSSELMFFKNALEKLDVEVQIIRHGKFKSAVEPFMLDKMSESNRAQMQLILNSTWISMLSAVTESRKISFETINELANLVKIQDANDALEHGFVDKLVYKDELIAVLKEKLAINDENDINYLKINKYAASLVNPMEELKKLNPSNKQIAVIYASGNIVSGESNDGDMGSETISKAIREARLDTNVKAIVLRVNSPGGSALASDIMWREVVLAKKAKPVVVSMGDVAASGGYFISCAADKIVADEKTITGSIGVFGVIPNAKGFFNNKIGITFDTVKTNTHSDMLTIFRPLTAEEKDIIQLGVEKIYDDFITKVAEGRGMTKAQIDSIGQGRVWVGSDAKRIGLVDEIGGMNKAIEIAKDMAKLDDYDLVAYPKIEKNPLTDIAIALTQDAETRIVKNKLGESYKYYQKIEKMATQSGIMAIMPFEIEIH